MMIQSFKRARALNSSVWYSQMTLGHCILLGFVSNVRKSFYCILPISYMWSPIMFFAHFLFYLFIYLFIFFAEVRKNWYPWNFTFVVVFLVRYAYLLCIKEHGCLSVIESKLRNSEYCTFVYCSQHFICACYRCLFSIPKVKKFDVDYVIDNMRKICNLYLGTSYVSRVTEQSAKTCFESAQPYLKMQEC